MTELRFKCNFYDEVYTRISSVLKEHFPQNQDEDMLTWYKRLLYEFLDYMNDANEPVTLDSKVNSGTKTNKRKQKKKNKVILEPVSELQFDGAIEKALDVVSEDSNFAIYLLDSWLLLLMGPSDWIQVQLNFDLTNTPAESVQLKSITFKISLLKIEILTVNGKPLEDSKRSGDPFLCRSIKSLRKGAEKATGQGIDPTKDSEVFLKGVHGPRQICNFLWELKKTIEPLFLQGIVFKSSFNIEEVTISKTNAEKSKSSRKKFNSRKFIKATDVSHNEMVAGILETLCISTFRTFYDFDETTMDQELYNYMFLGTDLTLT